jgi:hypothetical protein
MLNLLLLSHVFCVHYCELYPESLKPAKNNSLRPKESIDLYNVEAATEYQMMHFAKRGGSTRKIVFALNTECDDYYMHIKYLYILVCISCF